MKMLLIAFLALSLVSPPALQADVPAVRAAEAAGMAQEDLESRDLEDTIYIAEMRLKKGKPKEEPHWFILWSKSFPSNKEGHDEIGCRVYLDGSFARSVKAK